MRQKNGTRALACISACLLTGALAQARPSHGGDLFEALSGSWAGAGTVRTTDGATERLRCRASYAPSAGTSLTIELRCASDSFKLDVASTVTRTGDKISGAWRETSFGASGDVSGTINGQQISAVIQGMGMAGRLGLALHGATQSVTLAAENVGSASVVLRRE